MLGSFFRIATDHKQQVSKKRKLPDTFYQQQEVEIDSSASSGKQTKYIKSVIFPWPPLETAL